MKRLLSESLKLWKNKKNRMPLLLRGARQVGKTFLIEKLGETEFNKNILSINFEQKRHLQACFESLEPQKILNELELLTEQKIIAGETLLFLDEIQECPKAIMALRYFKEQMPTLHVIGAGSLLEFTLNDDDFRMPVGRLEFLYLQPLSFLEFLEAKGTPIILEQLKNFNLKNTPSENVHQHLLQLVREYTLLGGMPAVIQKYLDTQSFLEAQHMQSFILNAYRGDFGKYAKKTIHVNLQILFDKAPGLIAQWFKYNKVNPDIPPKEIKAALTQLKHAGIIYPVHACSASGLPLVTTSNEKKFKLLFLDVGLAKRASRLDSDVLLREDIFLLNGGALVEQFVGQELMAYQDSHEPPELFFWAREERNSSAEVDYLYVLNGHIFPIEVKSGATGRLKSLRLFMEEKKSKIGIRISETPLSFEHNILSVPFYLVSEIPRLLKGVLGTGPTVFN